MTWEELKEKAKEMGYKSGIDYMDVEYLCKSDIGITFYQNEYVTVYAHDNECILKRGVKYDKMLMIMRGLE